MAHPASARQALLTKSAICRQRNVKKREPVKKRTYDVLYRRVNTLEKKEKGINAVDAAGNTTKDDRGGKTLNRIRIPRTEERARFSRYSKK